MVSDQLPRNMNPEGSTPLPPPTEEQLTLECSFHLILFPKETREFWGKLLPAKEFLLLPTYINKLPSVFAWCLGMHSFTCNVPFQVVNMPL